MKTWKSKIDLLNHKLKIAKNLRDHLDIVSERVNQPPEPDVPQEEKTNSAFLKNKVTREKSFINAVANIPAYKSGEFYQLELINRRTKNMNVFNSPKQNGLHGLIHQNTLKLAKRRLAQVVTRLVKEAHRERKK